MIKHSSLSVIAFKALYIAFACGLVSIPYFLVISLLSLDFDSIGNMASLLPLFAACFQIAFSFLILQRYNKFRVLEMVKVFQPIWRTLLSLIVGVTSSLIVVNFGPGWKGMAEVRTTFHVGLLYGGLVTGGLIISLLVLLLFHIIAHILINVDISKARD